MKEFQLDEGCAKCFHASSGFLNSEVRGRLLNSKVGVKMSRDSFDFEVTNHMLFISQNISSTWRLYMCRLADRNSFVVESNQGGRVLRVGLEKGLESIAAIQLRSSENSLGLSLSSNGSVDVSLSDKWRQLKLGSAGFFGDACLKVVPGPLYLGVTVPRMRGDKGFEAFSLSARLLHQGWNISAFTQKWTPTELHVSTFRAIGSNQELLGKALWGLDRSGAFMTTSLSWRWLDVSLELPSRKFSCTASL
jgi:hypothetical protein